MFLTVLLLVIAGWWFLWAVEFTLRWQHDRREPPLITPRIPLLGHLIGIINQRSEYFTRLRYAVSLALLVNIPDYLKSIGSHSYVASLIDCRKNHPHLVAYTLQILGGKIHILSSSSLIKAVERSSKTLSFEPIGTRFSCLFLGPSKSAIKLLKSSNGAFTREMIRGIHHSAAPGVSLDSMTDSFVEALKETVRHLESREGHSLSLFSWTRHHMTQLTTSTVYGPMNPYRNLRVEEGFW